MRKNTGPTAMTFAPAGVRVEQLAEALQIIRALWTEPSATFQGKHHQIRDASHAPRPDPTPLILVGAFQPRMLRLTARYADWWNVSSTGIQAYRRMAATFEQACLDVGRELPPARRSWGGGCACRPTEAEARRLAGDRLSTDPDDDFDFVGTPDQIIEQMRPFIDSGVDYFMLDCVGFPDLTTVESAHRGGVAGVERLRSIHCATSCPEDKKRHRGR